MKIANQAARALGVSPGESLGLYAHVLNKHLYFFELEKCSAVDEQTVQHIISAISDMIESGQAEHGGTAAWRDAENYFLKIKADIKQKRVGVSTTSASAHAAERYRRLQM